MKKLKLILIILTLILFSIGLTFSYFVFIYKQKENNRKINYNYTIKIENHKDNFSNIYIESINKRKIDEKSNQKYKVEDVLTEEEYLLIKDFTFNFENEIKKNFNPIWEFENGFCEIIINPKNKSFNILNCHPNDLFKRSVELSINKFNNNFRLYNSVKDVNSRITIFFNYENKKKDKN